MAQRISLLLVFIVLMKITNAADYCKIETCANKDSHTMCKFKDSGPARRCFEKGNLGGQLSASDKKYFLDLHNHLRQYVAQGKEKRGNPGPQPGAQNMQLLTWDNELERVAQRWVDQCDYKHDECRDVGRFIVGQNIAWRGRIVNIPENQKDVIKNVVYAFYNEVQNYNKNDISEFKDMFNVKGQTIGHYTQMVWGETKYLGCAMRSYFAEGFYRKYAVCNYGPSGNFIGQPVYNITA